MSDGDGNGEGGEGGGEHAEEAWKSELPEEYRDKIIVQEAKSLQDFAKMAIEAQSMLGNSVRVPSEHASEGDRAQFVEKMSKHGLIPRDGAEGFLKPKDHDHYKLKETPIDAEDIGLGQSDIDKLKISAFKMDLSPKQFEEFADSFIEQRRQEVMDQRKVQRDAQDKLLDTWGQDAFDGKRVQALMAVRRFGGPELARKINENPDPDMLRAFADIGAKFEEAGLGDLETPMYTPESRQEAEQKLNEIRSNPNHPFTQGPMASGQQAYEEAAREVMRLRRISMGMSGKQQDYMFG